jgi:hypothetical protein
VACLWRMTEKSWVASGFERGKRFG